jgi:hypothetical protein
MSLILPQSTDVNHPNAHIKSVILHHHSNQLEHIFETLTQQWVENQLKKILADFFF